MAKNEEENNDEAWINFLRKHWKMAILFIAGISIAIVCAVLLFLWFILPTSISTSLVPMSLSLWTIVHIIAFILNVILWEFLFIIIPVIGCAAVIYLQWWKKLPEEEKEEYTGEPKRKGQRRRIRDGGGGGIISFLVTLTWLIIIYVDNHWDTPFAAWSIEYLVYSWIAALLWDLLILGVPMSIIAFLWIRHKMNE